MLQALRKSAGTWVVKIFLGILALSFVGWGVNDMLFTTPAAPVATVGGVEISANEFTNTYRREYDRLSKQLGGRLTPEQAREIRLAQSVLDQMVGRTLFAIAADDLGLAISTQALIEQIRADPAFANATGQFDPRVFQQAINAAGFSEAAYLASERGDTVREQLINTVAVEGEVPRTLADRLFAYREEKRVAELVLVPKNALPAPKEPTDAEIEKHYRDNQAMFTAPEYRSAKYIVLEPEAVAKEIAVSEAEIKEEYEAQIGRFTVAEKREVEQLLYDSETAAVAARAQVVSGRPLADVAAETKSSTAGSSSLGLITRDKLPAAVAETVFKLAAGAVSEPIKSPFGWHVFRVARIEAGSIKPLAEVADALKRDVALRRAGDAIVKLHEKVEDEFAGGAKLTEAGQKLGLKVETVAAVDARGRGADEKPLEGFARGGAFVAAVFGTQPGAEPRLRELPGGAYFAVEVTGVTPPAPKPLATVRDAAKAAWIEAERDAAARKAAEAVEQALKSGQKAADLAKDGRTHKTTQPLLRYRLDLDRDVSAELLTALFKLKIGETALGPTAERDGYAVAILKEVTAVAADVGDQRAVFEREVARAIGVDIGEAFQAALQKRYGVTTDTKAVERLF
jgi:peptidyl-prolyl cis-trans isomerase D